MARFEFIDKYADAGLTLPERKTAGSAGYDFMVAEDTVVPPYYTMYERMAGSIIYTKLDENSLEYILMEPVTLEEIAQHVKNADAKVTLVPTGVKCKLDEGTYLELSVRSSCPLKHWLIMGNAVGIIDSDYYGNPDNDGAIYFQLINLSPLPILLKKGDIIGQGIIKPYLKTEDDSASAARIGGFGSTTK